MRRVSSYGGPSGVAGSERLRQKLSSTPGLHLLSSSSLGEVGFLAVAGASKDERVFHRTHGAARNFSAIASNLKQVAKRESWLTRKDPFRSVVKERTVFDDPVDGHCNGGASPVLVEEVHGTHFSRSGPNVNGTREDGVEAVHEIPSSDGQVVKEVELEKSIGRSSSVDPPSNALAEVKGSLSTSPIIAGQDAQSSREGTCEADPVDKEAILSNETSQQVEIGAVLQDSENDRSKNMAVINIQSCWRGWQERKKFNEVKASVVFLQSLVRRNQEMKQYRITQAVLVLQKYWRMSQSKKALKRLKSEQALREQRKIFNAAIVVQKYWRSVRSRRLLNNFRKELDVRAQKRNNNAAVVLQKHWRAQRARCLLKVLKMEQTAREQRRIEDAAVVLQKHWRARQGRCLVNNLNMEQAVKKKQKINNAAIVLQKYWRAQQASCLMKRLRVEHVAQEKQRLDDAAVVMQKHWRARRGRRFVKEFRMEQVLREQQKIQHATIVLQKCWRGQQARRSVGFLKLELAAREQLRLDNAAIVLQKYWRAKQGRFVLRQLKSEKVVREQLRMDTAAIVLQKHWKAMQGRCSLTYLRMERFAKEHQRTSDAAIVMQKHWRAKQGRSYVECLKLEHLAKVQQRIDHAATVIQKHWRAQEGRCLVNCLRTEQAVREKHRIDEAAMVLQKHWQGRCGRILVKHKKMELELQRTNHAATVLQKLWRGRQGRGLVEHARIEQLVRQQKVVEATLVLQKHWRRVQSRCFATDLKKKQLEENAVLVVQKFWRAKQSRLIVKHLKLEIAARERHRASAATTLQKHWRARQSSLLVKHLKMEAAMRDQQRVDDAAIIFQRHWRGRHSRLLLKHLKCEQALRETERVDSAALVLQKYWRRFQSKQVVRFLYLEQQAARERAAQCIQARVRGSATRVKLKAALTIQNAWQLYWSAVSIHQVFPSSSDEKRKIQAIIFLQAYARGLVARRKWAQMPHLANLCLQPDHTSNKSFTKTGVSADTNSHMILNRSDLSVRCITEAGKFLEPSSGSCSVHHVDTGVKSVDQTYFSPIDSLKHDPYSSQVVGGEFSAKTVGDVQLKKKGVQEDWNYVPVDQLEECLDTCLATLRPLPSGSQHCLPGLDVPEKSEQHIARDPNVENRKIIDRVSTSTCEVAQHGPRTRSDIGEPDNESSDLSGSTSDKSRVQSDLAMPQATPSGGTDHLEISSGPLRETGSQQMENPVQGIRSLGRQTLKQNEQRLKQFAQVFLLQRHIALQQQRAQAAPPFPPPTSSGAEIPSQIVTQPLEVEARDQGEVAVDSITVHTDATSSQVDEGRSKDDHSVCEITDPKDEQTARRNSRADQNSGSKQVVNGPGPDVVLDMVLLLRRIEAEYGTSDFEGESSTWCTPGCGDLEEGIPLLDRNLGSMRRESSVSKFANAVIMKHISIPDMNAVLLVFIAMVVYTRTVCKGLFFGARQTHRRP
ncbi:unnamed protein product [Calypogeia fissa]